jgi:hypothetical protein
VYPFFEFSHFSIPLILPTILSLLLHSVDRIYRLCDQAIRKNHETALGLWKRFGNVLP